MIKPADGKESFDDTGYNPNADWMFGNIFNSYYTDEIKVGTWPTTAELNRIALPSPILGFTFDRARTKTYSAAISVALQDYATPLAGGLVETPERIANLNRALRNAGLARVRDEMQIQINAWLASRV